jgi:hypothetical protein
MSPRASKVKDALGRPVDPAGLYRCIEPHVSSAGSAPVSFNTTSILKGDHLYVQRASWAWAPLGTPDSEVPNPYAKPEALGPPVPPTRRPKRVSLYDQVIVDANGSRLHRDNPLAKATVSARPVVHKDVKNLRDAVMCVQLCRGLAEDGETIVSEVLVGEVLDRSHPVVVAEPSAFRALDAEDIEASS